MRRQKSEGGRDYGFQGTEAKDEGTYTLTVLGNGNYSGRATGSYTIAPAALTITTGSAEKAYDGTALTSAETIVSGLAHGESITVTTTGSQTEVGNSDNECEIDWGTVDEDNYLVSVIPGSLTVISSDTEIVLTAASDSKTYDGTALTNPGVSVSGLPEGFTVEATATGSATNVGDEGVNAVNEGYVIRNANGVDRTDWFRNVKTKAGKLTILPRSIASAAVMLDAESLTYNGTEKRVSVTDVTLDGEALTASAYDVTGVTGTDAGTYTATVTGQGNYGDTVTASWTIDRAEPTATDPAGKALYYTGSVQKLVDAGSAQGGTLYYAMTTESTAPADESLYAATIPATADIGTYYIWYKVVGDANHLDTEAACVTSTIEMPEFYEPDFVLPESLTAIEASAFEGVASLTVVDAANCTSIGADAFKGTGLVQIRLPKDCGFIGTPFDDDALIDVFAPAGGSTQDDCNDPAHVNLIFVAE